MESLEARQKRIRAIKLSYDNNPDIKKRISQANKISLNRPEIKEKFSGVNNPSKRPEVKVKISFAIKGRIHDEKQNEEQRQFMLNGGSVYASSFIKNPSKPQVELFKLLQQLCPNPIMNYPIYYRKKWNYSIDVADPKLALAVEYDEPYWHKHKGRDSLRQRRIEELGWKFLRYEKVPTLEQLKADINNLV